MTAKQNLASLTAFKAHQLLRKSASGTLATIIFMNTETTRALILGHSQLWYRQKNLILKHLCLIGEGSIKHQAAMKEYKRGLKIEEKKTTTATHIFRAAIVDLKLGATARQFETLISFLVSCNVDVGKIGHSQNNFDDILYCLETAINKKVTNWLKVPHLSTLLPPHFGSQLIKAHHHD